MTDNQLRRIREAASRVGPAFERLNRSVAELVESIRGLRVKLEERKRLKKGC